VGDWYPDPKKFPHGLTAIAEDAHGVHWDAIEYFDPSRKRGAIYVFRGSTAHHPSFCSQGTRPGIPISRDVPRSFFRSQGRSWSRFDENGLLLQLPLINSSEIVFLREETPGR